MEFLGGLFAAIVQFISAHWEFFGGAGVLSAIGAAIKWFLNRRRDIALDNAAVRKAKAEATKLEAEAGTASAAEEEVWRKLYNEVVGEVARMIAAHRQEMKDAAEKLEAAQKEIERLGRKVKELEAGTAVVALLQSEVNHLRDEVGDLQDYVTLMDAYVNEVEAHPHFTELQSGLTRKRPTLKIRERDRDRENRRERTESDGSDNNPA